MSTKKFTLTHYICFVTVLVLSGCAGYFGFDRFVAINSLMDSVRHGRPCTTIPEYVRHPFSPAPFSLPEEVPPDNDEMISIYYLIIALKPDVIENPADDRVQRTSPPRKSFPLYVPADVSCGPSIAIKDTIDSNSEINRFLNTMEDANDPGDSKNSDNTDDDFFSKPSRRIYVLKLESHLEQPQRLQQDTITST